MKASRPQWLGFRSSAKAACSEGLACAAGLAPCRHVFHISETMKLPSSKQHCCVELTVECFI